MDGGFQANTLKLREHGDLLLRERSIAQELCERLRAARRYAASEDAWRYEALIRQAEMLSRYFGDMGDQVDRMEMELVQLSTEINTLLRDTASYIRQKASIFHT